MKQNGSSRISLFYFFISAISSEFVLLIQSLFNHFWQTKENQWLSGGVLDSRPRGRRFEPRQPHCVVSLSKNIDPSLVVVHPRKNRPFIAKILLMGRKESRLTITINWWPSLVIAHIIFLCTKVKE